MKDTHEITTIVLPHDSISGSLNLRQHLLKVYTREESMDIMKDCEMVFSHIVKSIIQKNDLTNFNKYFLYLPFYNIYENGTIAILAPFKNTGLVSIPVLSQKDYESWQQTIMN